MVLENHYHVRNYFRFILKICLSFDNCFMIDLHLLSYGCMEKVARCKREVIIYCCVIFVTV